MYLEIERCKECGGLGWHRKNCIKIKKDVPMPKPIINGYNAENGYSK